jgi:U3 small nucleolar RNA-associated protein 22
MCLFLITVWSYRLLLQKRNRVVWTLARLLAKDVDSPDMLRSNASTALFWRYQHGDVRKAMIVVIQAKFCIEILVGVASVEWISSPLRLVPNRGNLGDGIPTPHYNNAVLEDLHERELLLKMSSSINGDAAVTHAIGQAGTLAKVWCLQRGLLRGHDTMQEAHILFLLHYLLRTRRINPRLAPTQILAAWFKLVSETDWMGENGPAASESVDASDSSGNLIRKAPSEAYRDIRILSSNSPGHPHRRRTILVLPDDGLTENQTVGKSKLAHLYEHATRETPLTDSDPPTLTALYQQSTAIAAVLLDPTLSYNCLGRWSPSFVQLLQREASHSLSILQSPSPTSYSDLFLREARFWSRYDAYFRIRVSEIASVVNHSSRNRHEPLKTGPGQALWGFDRLDLGTFESISRGILHVLSLALGDRVKEMRLLTSGNGEVRDVRSGASSSFESDEIPRWPVVSVHDCDRKNKKSSEADRSKSINTPTGSDWVVIGFTFNSDTCARVVDRGPPAVDVAATEAFLGLWGKAKAQLRRFKDGAIVHAVVWDDVPEEDENTGISPYVRFENDDKFLGGVVERIVRHIVRLHFLGNPKTPPSSLEFSLRGILSAVDGVLHGQDNETETRKRFNALTAHRTAIKAFESLSQFLRTNSLRTEPVPGTTELASRLGIPLAIDAVEPLSPALRYSELFPPVPHPLLALTSVHGFKEKRIPGAILSDPIEIQIRFGPSSKWPTDLRAIGAAKAAMLVRIVDGIETMRKTGTGGSGSFYAFPCVTSCYADVGWMGYVFRLRVRADPELKLLRSLNKPTEEASFLLRELIRQHVVAPSHHTMILSVYTSHPSSTAVTRLAKRWLASHLLSNHFPFEAIELLVASVYSSKASIGPPASVVAGFLRFLRLLGSHDWAQDPLIVDPHGMFSPDMIKDITKRFEHIRGPDYQRGPAMFVVSPCDRQDDATQSQIDGFLPSFTASTPERVVLARAAKLARRSYFFLKQSLRSFETDWSSAFLESKASFHSYSALLRVSPDLVTDPNPCSSTDTGLCVRLGTSSRLQSSYTRSMLCRFRGPKELERKAYRNIGDRDEGNIILYWNPVGSLIQTLSARLSPYALFFCNELCPNVISVLWRPLFEPRAFSAMVSEHARPISADDWKPDTLVTLNVRDILRDIAQYTSDIVVNVKLLDPGPAIAPPSARKRKRAPATPEEVRDAGTSSPSSSDGDSSDSASEDE